MPNIVGGAIRGGVQHLTSSLAADGVGRPGPPAAFDVLFTWWVVSAAAYGCFIRLPRKLDPQFSLVTRAKTSFNDFAWAAHSLHLCATLWFAYDVLFRVCCVLTLPVPVLRRLQFLPAQQAERTTFLPEGVLSFLDGIRTTFTVGNSVFFVEDSTSQQSSPVGLSFYGAVVSTSVICFGCVLCATWWFHTRRFWRGELVEQQLTMTNPRTGDPMPIPRQYAVRVSIVPRSFWMLLWFLVVLTSFTWYRALAALSSMVYPACVCLLLALDVLMP